MRQLLLRNASSPSVSSIDTERFNFLPWWSQQTLHRWWLHPLVAHRVWIYSSPARLHLSSSLPDHSLCPSTVQGPLGRTHEHGWERGSIYCIIFKNTANTDFLCLPRALLMRARYLSMFRYVQFRKDNPGWIALSTCKISSMSLVL